METFEIHITGDGNKIISVLNDLNFKNIEIKLLGPDGKLLSTEFMSSIVKKFKHIDDCIKWTEGLSAMLEASGVKVLRKKIECPFIPYYINRALYFEAHWKLEVSNDMKEFTYPTSYNADNSKYLATDRTYRTTLTAFTVWKESLNNFDNVEVEMCLYDTFIGEDKHWFDLYDMFLD